MAEVDLVDIEFENFILAQFALDLQRKEDLIDLAREASLAGQEEILRHLHGDGAAAGLDVPAFQYLRGSAHQAGKVDAIMIGKVVVFGG
ncbi:hypothetical protein D9M68_830970 [compost metagenome]